MKIRTIAYLHSNKESMSDLFEQACGENGVIPTHDAINMAAYACYEVGVEVEFDTETGDCLLIGLKDE